ncbi:bifunctional metallophosphatase/5'-nucleotidase [Sporosarcina koreensis]|uniref:bifunctional metallophosphatase/5'-nucleotidase n=1 Tax=Sporosarcina koreensis TaxID=334735 RepID=UPI000590A015|nr:bifunctional UDP-sugar hydrolase/5'-nucleotidase [Sporosarcina koreensis]
MIGITQKTETIHIYHTNDVHSHFDNWPGIHEYLLQQRKQHELAGESVFVFDLGDFVDRSHPFTEATHGKGNTELLNRARYDAVTIGNNEGITLPPEDLAHLYDDAAFDVIVANLSEAGGRPLEWAVPYEQYETAQGTSVAVIAATAVYEAFYGKLGWAVSEPLPILKTLAEQLKETSDVVICLSHLGIHEDRKLAAETGDIDVILGAHTHHLFLRGEWEGTTLLAATGKYGQYVGHMCITLEAGQITDRVAAVIPAEQLNAPPAAERAFGLFLQAGEELLDETVFKSPCPLSQNLSGPSGLSDFFGRALLAYTGADCALFNAGLFLGSLPEGDVTLRDLHRVLPHPINACVMTVTGRALLEYWIISDDPSWIRTEVRGLGFRGTMMGAMIQTRLSMEDGLLYIGSERVRMDRTYKLATLDMFTFGFFYPDMKSEKIDYLVPELIRDIAGWYGRQLGN